MNHSSHLRNKKHASPKPPKNYLKSSCLTSVGSVWSLPPHQFLLGNTRGVSVIGESLENSWVLGKPWRHGKSPFLKFGKSLNSIRHVHPFSYIFHRKRLIFITRSDSVKTWVAVALGGWMLICDCISIEGADTKVEDILEHFSGDWCVQVSWKPLHLFCVNFPKNLDTNHRHNIRVIKRLKMHEP